MTKRWHWFALFVVVAGAVIIRAFKLAGYDREPTVEELVAAVAPDATVVRLNITYPQEGTLFPPESVAPTFVWDDKASTAQRWLVLVRSEDGTELLRTVVGAPSWRPSEKDWKHIK